MNIIEYEKIFTQLKDDILNQTEILEVPLNYAFYKDTGEYIDDMTNNHLQEDTILCNIVNGGGVQDPSVSIDTYAQIVSMEFLSLEEHREKLVEVLTNFIANNKSKIVTIDNALCQYSLDSLPTYSEKFEVHGKEQFTASIGLTIIVMPGAHISNNTELQIDGQVIKYNQMRITRDTELTANLKKTQSTKFFPNSSTLQIGISGLFVENETLRAILYDCAQNTKFNEKYVINIKDGSSDIISGQQFYAKNISFTFAYGAIINWEITLFEGTTL